MTDRLRFGLLISLLLFATIEIDAISHGKPVPIRQKLAAFPYEIQGWSGRDLPGLSEGEKRVLRGSDYLLRAYDRGGRGVGLYIVYYQQQESGDAIHSPRNCLPGSGWEPVESKVCIVPSVGAGKPSFKANYYVVEKDGVQQEVLYWYRAGETEYASEYLGKIYLVWDGITRHRTDGALIRITAGEGTRNSRELGPMLEFAREISRLLPNFLPA